MLKGIPKNVFVLGAVSFFNDIASEMIYPIIPIFLTAVLNAPVSVVGLIEGVAEAVASIMKFVSGYISDRSQKRKIFVVGGYGLSSVSKLILSFAYFWPFVLLARFIDRFGKGVRTSARDSLLLQNTTSKNKGFIFGFHRTMDSAGAVIGPLIAMLLLFIWEGNIRLIFMIAFIPSLIGLILLVLFVKEKKQEINNKKIIISLKWKDMNSQFKFFLLVSFIFALGNSSDAFLILRSKELGLTTALVTLTYVLYNISQTVFATPGGKLADKIGARKVFIIGLIIFSFVYFMFGIINKSTWIWFLYPIYGIYIAFTDGVSKAYISEFITEKESGTYFGIYQTVIAFCSFFASFLGGILWSKIGSSATFFYGSLMAVIALSFFLYGKVIRKI